MRDTVLVSIDYNDKSKKGVLCVGRQLPNKSVDMVNAIETLPYSELITGEEIAYEKETH